MAGTGQVEALVDVGEALRQQPVERPRLNEKDLRDILALLLDHESDTPRVLAVTHADWGFEHTIRRTLAGVRERAGDFGLAPSAVATVLARAGALDPALEAAPKSPKWRMRARVGERARWYEEPEEARG
jgi:hypothetical protein